MTRRKALIGVLTSLMASNLPARSWAQQAFAIDGATLAAFLDVLLPADDLSPSASALGVHDGIAAFAPDVEGLASFVGGGTVWLNQAAAAPFLDLPPEAREALVTWMAGSDQSAPPFVFYSTVRRLAVEFYYAHPDAIAGYPLDVAPQPAGFPPPWT